MKSSVKTALTAWVCTLLIGCSQGAKVPEFVESELTPGGGMTTKRLSKRTFINAGESVSSMDKLNFWTGFSLFRDPWVTAPSTTADRDGLGPLFNTRSCISCHVAGARGIPETAGVISPSALIIRLNPIEDKDLVDPVYGGQFQPRAIPLQHSDWEQRLLGEGKLQLEYTEVQGEFADGESYTLIQPHYSLTQLNYGDVISGIGLSPRFAPVIYGAGLIDAIAEQDLLALEDIDDSNNDGISAKYNRVINVQSREVAIGRFGLKGLHPTLKQQVAGALTNDIGIHNLLFQGDTCTESQIACQQASAFGRDAGQNDPEISDSLIELVMDFSRWIGVPPTRQLTAKTSQKGRAKFYQAGCANCHTPSFVTDANYNDPYLAGQKIYPYSNFALHDMGEGLADNTLENQASGREWRTPPLWGLGLQTAYRSKSRFLHDGRARNLSEAILWHGGEAKASQQQFLNMNKRDRQDLLTFLKAI